MWTGLRLRVAVLMMIIGLAFGLTACAGSTAPPASDGCLIFRPIHADPTVDSAETVRQVDSHNAVGVAVCGWSDRSP